MSDIPDTDDMSEIPEIVEEDMYVPPGFNSMTDLVDAGISGMVWHHKPTNTVLKTPHGTENDAEIDVERRIYERFEANGGHASLLHYYGFHARGIRLEYVSPGSLHKYLGRHNGEIDVRQRLVWAREVAEAMVFFHTLHVIHGDFSCWNILLDAHMHARVADFAGASLDGSERLIVAAYTYDWPGGDNFRTRTDVFALGSVIYQIMTGSPPYHGLTEHEVELLYKKGEFPGLANLESLGMIGQLILRCWTKDDYSARAAVEDIKERRCIFVWKKRLYS